jgi:hypothetical protein
MIFFVLLTSQAFAISPVNNDLITEASNYGETHVQVAWNDFAAPWSSFEEKAGKLDEAAEIAYLYTPFLLIAADVKEKTLTKQNISSMDTEKLLADYKGFLVFSVKLLGNDKNFTQGCTALIKQDNKTVKMQQAAIPNEAAETTWNAKEHTFLAQCYFYFLENEVDLNKSIILEIIKQDGNKSNFYFNLPKIK